MFLNDRYHKVLVSLFRWPVLHQSIILFKWGLLFLFLGLKSTVKISWRSQVALNKSQKSNKREKIQENKKARKKYNKIYRKPPHKVST